MSSDKPASSEPASDVPCPWCEGKGSLLGAGPDRGNPPCEKCSGTGIQRLASDAAKGADEVLVQLPDEGCGVFQIRSDGRWWVERDGRWIPWRTASPAETKLAALLRDERAAHEVTRQALETATELAEQYRQRAESLSLSLRMAGKGAP